MSNYLMRSLQQTRNDVIPRCVDHARRTITDPPPIYTGMTALQLIGIETPMCRKLSDARVQVLHDDRAQRPTRKDTSYLRRPPALRHVTTLSWTTQDGIVTFTHPLVTWAMLAPHLTQVETIVLADAMIRATASVCPVTVDDIRRFLDTVGKFPGRQKCTNALQFLGAVTDSPMECRSVLALLQYGLPEPVRQWKIYIPALAQEATVDIAYPDRKVIIEYDGDAHRRDKQQYRRDERKRQALRAMGYTVIVVFADDVLSEEGRERFARRVADALGIDFSGMPLPQFEALLTDKRMEEARQRQHRYRLRERSKGRKV